MKLLITKTLLIILILLTSEMLAQISWTDTSAIKNARFRHRAIVSNGKIYAIGGNSGSSVLNSVEVYDPSTKLWSDAASIQMARYGFGAAQAGDSGKIYIFGGEGPYGGRWAPEVEKYNAVTNKWQRMKDWTRPRNDMAMGVINGQIYIAGGRTGYGATDGTVERYDPNTDQFTTLAPLLQHRMIAAGAVVNGKFYVIGGIIKLSESHYTLTNKVEMYDPALNKWEYKADMPESFELIRAVVNNNNILIFGRFLANQYVTHILSYNTITDTWSTLSVNEKLFPESECVLLNYNLYSIAGNDVIQSKPTNKVFITELNTTNLAATEYLKYARNSHRAIISNGKIFAIGGNNVLSSTLTSVEVYDPSTKLWSDAASIQMARYGFGAAQTGDSGKIYIFGGEGPYGGRWAPEVERYNAVTNKWQRMKDWARPRNDMAMGVINGQIYIAGGRTGYGATDSTVERYDPNTDQFTKVAPLLQHRRLAAGAVVNGKFYVIGGIIKLSESHNMSTNKIEMYDPSLNKWEYKADMPESFNSIRAVVNNNNIIVFGNLPSNPYVTHILSYNTLTNTWTTLSVIEKFYPESEFVMLNNIYYSIAGIDYIQYKSVNKVFVFSNITDVDDDSRKNVVETFTLSQNFPNPFNPSTTINYTINENCHVILSIFNSLGEKVCDLVNEAQNSGSYSVKWTANVPSGIYLYKLETINDITGNVKNSSAKKMILIK